MLQVNVLMAEERRNVGEYRENVKVYHDRSKLRTIKITFFRGSHPCFISFSSIQYDMLNASS